MSLPVHIRPMCIDDAPFIIDSWCSSYSRSPEVSRIDEQVFKIEQRNLINRLIPRCKVLVACDPDRHTFIRGWLVFEAAREPGGLAIVHYALTKPECQKHGVANALLSNVRTTSPDGMVWATHATHASRWFGKTYMIYNPYLKFMEGPNTKRNELKGYY
jgi:hypothetical protein